MFNTATLYLKFLGRGRHRIVFQRGNYVYKFPLNENGLVSNRREHNFYHKYRKASYVPYAACKIFGSILVMEYIKPEYNYTILPDWCYSVDAMQVGYDRNNKLVAYDYGY